MLKKCAWFVMVLTLVLVMAACGSNSPTAGTSPAPADASSGAAAPAAAEQPAPAAQEPETLTVKHQLGEAVVSKNPQKVVVFDFGVLDSLDKLGIEVTGVPQANIPAYLEKYKDKKYQNVGSLKEPDFEKIAEIDPDLILISGRQSAAYEELTKLGPTVFMGVDTSKYMESYSVNAKTLGEIFGKEDAVEAELAKVSEEIKALSARASASGKNALIILANDGSISAYGAGSRFGIIHDVFGLSPVDENIEVSTHGMSISFEYIVEKNPDYLFVIDRGAAVAEGQTTAASLVENELVKKTKAYQDGNIVYLDPDYWYLSGGGLISVAEMVKQVSEGVK